MGIRIAFTDPNALIKRCDTAIGRIADGEDGVQNGAVTPDADWQPLRPDEAEQLAAGPDDQANTVTELVRVLPDWTPDPQRPLIDHIGAFDPFAGRHASTFLAHVDERPGQRTTTIDPAVDLRLGIHLDNHDKLPLEQRTASRRRLGLNLGPGVRHLLIGTLDIFEIGAAIGADPRYFPHTDDIRRHVAAGRPLRLLRIRLDPGDAYITPTELVPHDGSTLTAAAPSRIAFWLGHWPVGAIGSLV